MSENPEEIIDGSIILDDGTIVDEPLTKAESLRRKQRAAECIGQPFIHLPGNPPDHKVLGRFWMKKIRANMVEMVWNDKMLVDYVVYEGKYRADLEKRGNAFMLAILDLAEKLYNDN